MSYNTHTCGFCSCPPPPAPRSRRQHLLDEAYVAVELIAQAGYTFPDSVKHLEDTMLPFMTDVELMLVHDQCVASYVEQSKVEVLEKLLAEPFDAHPREAVYEAIDSERDYQDNVIETDQTRHDADEPAHTVGDYLTLLATYLRKAQDDWTSFGGVQPSLHQIRKIAAIAVHCMEDHGAPLRKFEAPCKEEPPCEGKPGSAFDEGLNYTQDAVAPGFAD